MPQSPRQPARRHPRKALKTSFALSLLATLAIVGWRYSQRHRSDAPDAVDRTAAVPRPPRPLQPAHQSSAEEWAAWRARYDQWLASDGRKLEPGLAASARGLNTKSNLQLALDELVVLNPQGALAFNRIQPQDHRRGLAGVVEHEWKGARAVYPVLYPRGIARTAASAHIVTGQIVTALKPGVTAREIAGAYGLTPVAGISPAGLTRFVAKTAFAALEIVPKLARDARIAAADHDVITAVQPKSVFPVDQFFPEQWHLLPSLAEGQAALFEEGVEDFIQSDEYHLNIYPRLFVPPGWSRPQPVWGDFAADEDEADVNRRGIRGRGVRVGIVDDGFQTDHPDFRPDFGATGHHAYLLTAQSATLQDPYPPPLVQSWSGDTWVNHARYVNQAHGTAMAGVISALANNGRQGGNGNLGVVGVAPESIPVGIRALTYYIPDPSVGGVPQQPDLSQNPASLGSLLAPTQDAIIAAASQYLSGGAGGYGFPGRTVYEGTPAETFIPLWSDVEPSDSLPIPIKNLGFGAPDNNSLNGPGPETAGYRTLENPLEYIPGARARAALLGRNGLGTIFVAPSGNGRMWMDNSNNDGYASSRYVIAVGGLSRIAGNHFNNSGADHLHMFSEPGSNVMLCAPLGGPYLINKRSRGSYYNTQYPIYAERAILDTINGERAIQTIPSTDWDVAQASEEPKLDEYIFGSNTGTAGVGGEITPDNYDDGAWNRHGTGTSYSAAMVSGVVALMLEANPRLSWLDVQDILIRTARNHLMPGTEAITESPITEDDNLNLFDGIDTLDYMDVEPLDRDWLKNGANLWFNHKYGAGLVDARRAVDRAIQGHLIPPQTDIVSGVPIVPSAFFSEKIELGLPGKPAVLERYLSVPVPERFHITQVELYIGKAIGDLSRTAIKLSSPSGMESTLLEGASALTREGITAHTFTTFRHWGESGGEQATNDWKLTVTTTNNTQLILCPDPEDPLSPEPRGHVILTVHGFIPPPPPTLTRPESNDPANPTIVEWPLEDHDSYTLSGTGMITRWHVYDGSGALPDPSLRAFGFPANNPTSWSWEMGFPYQPVTPVPFTIADGLGKPGLPEGLGFPRYNDPASASAETTYQTSLAITGTVDTDDAKVGDKFDLVVSAANYSGETELRYLRLIIVPGSTNDAFTHWARAYFGDTAAEQPVAYGDADPDGDGTINALEYALGLHPTRADGEKAWTAGLTADNEFAVTFNRYLDRECVYELQTSSTLEEGEWTTVVISDYEDDTGGVPKKEGDAAYEVSEGADIEDAEPFSKHRLVTVKLNPAEPAPLYYRLLVRPYSNALRPRP